MKNTLTATIIFVFLISVASGMQAVGIAKANFMLVPGYPANICIQLPQNQTYCTRTLPLNITIEAFNEEHFPTFYCLNNQTPVAIDTQMSSSRVVAVQVWDGWSSEPNQTENHVLYTLEGNAVLADLSDGTYNLTVQRFLSDGKTLVNATTVIFSVDVPLPSISPHLSSSPSPHLSLSPQQPTLAPIQTATPFVDGFQIVNYTPMIIVISIVIMAVVVGLLAYLAKFRGWK